VEKWGGKGRDRPWPVSTERNYFRAHIGVNPNLFVSSQNKQKSNMKFLHILLAVLFLQSSNLLAQERDSTSTKSSLSTQNIKGSVIDKSTRVPLAGVTIKLLTGQHTAEFVTNEMGEFRISGVRTGRNILDASFTGYAGITLPELLVTSGKETIVNLEMESRSNNLNEVVVMGGADRKPLNQMAMVSGRSFSPEETNRYAGAAFDPARMAQSFAGVVAAGDNNEIIVRGNSPKSLQWRLEGIEIVNPNHFGNEGGSGGGISMLNTTVLSTSDFYTGGLAAEYGNALSGAFDLKFRKGNTEKREYAFNVGILGVGATLEGPFKKGNNASYLVSYRYSSLSLLEKAGLSVASDGVPKYQDLSFNFVVPTKKAGTFSLFGIGGLGDISDEAERDYASWKERFDGRDANFGYDAGSVGVKHMFIASKKVYFNNIISYSASRGSFTVDSLTNTYNKILRDKSLNDNSSIRYAGSMNYSINSSNIIRAGVNANFLAYDFFTQNFDPLTNSLRELVNHNGNTSSYDAFVQHRMQLNSKLTLNTGVHANYFTLSDSWSIEPRIGFNWQVSQDQLVSFGAGIYSRLEPLSYYFAKDRLAPTQNSDELKPTKSAQATLGYEKTFASNLKFKSEVYYQHLYDVPVSSDAAINFSLLDVADNSAIYSSSYRQLTNKGTGTNYGLELTLEKPLNRGYYFMATTSLFDSKFKAISKHEFNTSFNTNYVGNLIAGKEWRAGKKKNNLFGLNAKMIYAGGRKYSPVNLAESIRLDEEVIDQTSVNTLTTDPYVRVDFSASYRINSKRAGHFILLDIQNVLNKENVLGMHYNTSKRVIEPRKWTGIIPSLNYRIEF
jgi:hypothetical protein